MTFLAYFREKAPLFFEIGGTFRMDSPYLSTRLLGGIDQIGGTKLFHTLRSKR
jgi:hypothetical protein